MLAEVKTFICINFAAAQKMHRNVYNLQNSIFCSSCEHDLGIFTNVAKYSNCKNDPVGGFFTVGVPMNKVPGADVSGYFVLRLQR
jgi:hypothetical protein